MSASSRFTPLIAAAVVALGFPASLQASPPPMERMIVVRSAEAPLLNEIESDEPAVEVARAGELLEVLRPLPPMDLGWQSVMIFGGPTVERGGPMAEVRRAPGDAILFAFTVDFGDTVEVPAANWFCERIAADSSLPEAARRTGCARMLRRVLLPSGAVVAFEPCVSGSCPAAWWHDGRLSTIAIDGIVSARVVAGRGDGVLLLTTRWVRDNGTWSGGTLAPVALSGDSLARLTDIPIDEVDARDAMQVVSREVKVEITSPEPGRSVVQVSGHSRVRARADGRELSSKPVGEWHQLP